jgi:3-oxoadipate enol-lactonase
VEQAQDVQCVIEMPTANVHGIDTYYRVLGQGEPLILIMGHGAGHSGWRFHADAFKRYYKVITFDSRGIGKTGGRGEHYTIRMVADNTVGLMDHLGLDKAHVLGASLGGMIAQEVAINYPERVRKLVLVSTTPGGWEVSETHPEVLRVMGVKDSPDEVDFGSVDVGEWIGVMISLSFNRRLYRMLLTPLSKLYLKSVAGVEGIIGQLEATPEYDTRDRLYLIKAPTLVMTGTEDRLIPPSHSEAIASRIPNAKLVKVEGGSHAFLVEMRGRFRQEVLDFLRAG